METAESCQICFEHVPAAQFIAGGLCHPMCPARVCHACLVGHLHASLDACYSGVLPRVRCPICLSRVNKTRWSALTDATAPDLSARYAVFCNTACSLQAPCCHKVGYSHLPNVDVKNELAAVDSALPLTLKQQLLEDQASPADSEPTATAGNNDTATPEDDARTLEFLARCREFTFHRSESRAVVQFALDAFQDPVRAAAVIEAALTRIVDDERRAMLLLSFLYLRPAAVTRCCQRAFCFNCKRAGHHDTCDSEEIAVATCVARCRSCRVMIVKVEGCDSVSCVCGFTMGWGRELEIQSRYQRQLLAVDMFDREVFDKWERWRVQIRGWAPAFAEKLERRRERVLVRRYLPKLRQRLAGYIWWFRANRKREQLQREVFWAAYERTHPGEMASELDVCMRGLLAIKVELGGDAAAAVTGATTATVAVEAQ